MNTAILMFIKEALDRFGKKSPNFIVRLQVVCGILSVVCGILLTPAPDFFGWDVPPKIEAICTYLIEAFVFLGLGGQFAKRDPQPPIPPAK